MRVPVRTGKKRRPDADSSASSGTANAVSGVSGLIGAFGITNAPTTVCKTLTDSRCSESRPSLLMARWAHHVLPHQPRKFVAKHQWTISLFDILECMCTRLLCAQHVAGLAVSQHHLEKVRRHRHEVRHLRTTPIGTTVHSCRGCCAACTGWSGTHCEAGGACQTVANMMQSCEEWYST